MKARGVAWAYSLLVVVSALYGVLRFAHGTPVESDLLALLPATEKHPYAELAVQAVAKSSGERAVFLISAAQFSEAAAAARRLAALLAAQKQAFRRVTHEFAPDPRVLVLTHLPHQGHLLTPEDSRDLRRDAPGTLAARVQERLHAPPFLGPQTPIAVDPFGFLQRYLARLPLAAGKLSLREGLLTTEAEGRSHVLIFADADGSVYEARVQDAVRLALERSTVLLDSEYPNATLRYSGAVFFAAAARGQAESEMNRIGGFSLAAVLLLLAVVFRSWRHLWIGLLPIVAGLSVATACCLVFYDRLHVLTLACGATLIGVAVDYSFHYFAMQLDRGRAWDSEAAWIAFRPALRLGVLTTMGGYALLVVLPFPGLRQMAVFSVVGIAAAALAVGIWLPPLLRAPLRRDAGLLLRAPAAALAVSRRVLSPRRVLAAAGLAAALAIPGWLALEGKDDIRLLIAPPQSLLDAEASLRKLVGWGGGNQVYLVEGADERQLTERELALLNRLRDLRQRGAITGFNSIAEFVPATNEQQAAHTALGEAWRSGAVETALQRAGFDSETIARAQAAFGDSRPLTRAAWLASPLAGRHQALALDPKVSLVVPQGQQDIAVLYQASAELEGVTLIDKPGSISELFRQYRRFSTGALLAAFPLALGLLSRRLGWRAAALVAAPAAAAILLTLAGFGWAGEGLTLFHLLGLFLVFGMGIDYAIFLFDDGGGRPAVFLGVLLAAATTLLSFGLLAGSSLPALRAFGLTIFVGISLAVLCAPAVLLAKPTA